VRRARDVRRVSFTRGARRRFTVAIVTTNSRGGEVITRRSYDGCTRTRLVVTLRPRR
jgi:hypothetical protein